MRVFQVSKTHIHENYSGSLWEKEEKFGGRISCKELSVKFSFRLPFQCSVFKVEVAAIKVAEHVLLRSLTHFQGGEHLLRLQSGPMKLEWA